MINRSAGSFLEPFLLAAVAVVAFATATPPAHAQVTAAEAKCRSTIAKGSAKYMKALGKAVVSCHKARNAGDIGSMVDCSDPAQADYAGKAAKAAISAAAGIAKSCSATPTVLSQFGRCPAPQETIDDGGATAGIDSFEELGDCLNAHARDLAGAAAAQGMGLPTLPLSEDLASCHAAIGKAYTKYIDSVIKVRAKCQKAIDKTGGPLDFACATSDPDGNIEKARLTARNAILGACQVVSAVGRRSARANELPTLGACAETIEELADCAIDVAATAAGGGSASMMWELPGVCPGTGAYAVAPVATGTQLDAGYTGTVHDMDPTLGFRAVNFDMSCDPDCTTCTTVGVSPSPEACRCSDDNSLVCTDNADCAGDCECFYGPPAAFAAAGAPACVVSVISGTMSGDFDTVGGDLDLTVPLRTKIHLGIGIEQPCPVCSAGVCKGGERNGLSCTVDAIDATFGSMSYDCPPNPGGNISGSGLRTLVSFTTGTVSEPFGTACDAPLGAFDCACAMCSTDVTVACNGDSDCTGLPNKCSAVNSNVVCGNNADCAAANVGPCNLGIGRCQNAFSTVCGSNTDCASVNVGTCLAPACNSRGGGPSRRPNNCDDMVCSPDGGDPTEGTCLAGPVDTYCDGLLRSNGEGIIPCSTNTDCEAYSSGSVDPDDWVCADDDCGDCTLNKDRECFLDPIAGQGEPGVSVVGIGCLGVTSNSAVNAVVGLPGAYRVFQQLDAELLCSDGITPFFPPGGSNCP